MLKYMAFIDEINIFMAGYIFHCEANKLFNDNHNHNNNI